MREIARMGLVLGVLDNQSAMHLIKEFLEEEFRFLKSLRLALLIVLSTL